MKITFTADLYKPAQFACALVFANKNLQIFILERLNNRLALGTAMF